MKHRTWVVSSILALAVGTSSIAWAGETEAKEYLEKAKKDVADKNAGSAKTNLELAEAELDGVAEATRKSLQQQIEQLRSELDSGANAEARARLDRDIQSAIKDLKNRLDSGGTITDDLKRIQEVISDKDNAKILGAEGVAKVEKTLSTYRKINARRVADDALDRLKREAESAEKRMPEIRSELARAIKEELSGTRDGALRDWNNILESLQRYVDLVGEDNPKATAEIAAFNKLKTEYNDAYGKAIATDKLAEMKRGLEIYADDWAGWEEEKKGPTFAEMCSEQGHAISRLNCPKTTELISRSNAWFATRANDPDFKIVENDPAIKAFYADVKAKRQAAWDKVAGFADAILKEIEATKVDLRQRNRVEQFITDDLRLSLEEYPGLPALQARGHKVINAFDEAALGVEKAKEKALADATESAKKNWGAIAQKYKPIDDFDPANWKASKGKLIRLQDVNNRMGWDYKPGDFDFAVTVNGIPIAGKYSPAIKEAIKSIEDRTGKLLPEGVPYDLFAIVESQGRLMQRKQNEARGTVEGVGNVTTRWETAEPVDAVVVKIIALYMGPVAAEQGR